ncbi:MAG: hypothetical protein EP338_13705 [Bacteroidetes bacterium]|nr:MAG: hypothetical protein EP338_13705 [Bacteroidota bacterium]
MEGSQTKTWTGRKIDLLISLFYFLIYACMIHIMTSISRVIEDGKDLTEELSSPGNYLLSILLVFVFMSPIWVYFRKVPKRLSLNREQNKLEIEKRNRQLRYDLDRIKFHQRQTLLFSILEIHAKFSTPRLGEIEKMATSIVVPRWGLSWNQKTLRNIARELKASGVVELQNLPKKPVVSYWYD